MRVHQKEVTYGERYCLPRVNFGNESTLGRIGELGFERASQICLCHDVGKPNPSFSRPAQGRGKPVVVSSVVDVDDVKGAWFRHPDNILNKSKNVDHILA